MDAEAEGFAQFVEARQRALQRTAWLLTGDWAAAEDLVQTALVRSWPRWERIRRRDDPEIYVRRAMLNTWASWRRRRWWGERPSEAVPDAQAVGDMATEVTVRNQYVRPGRPPVPVDYAMRKSPEGWKIYDIVIEGVSLVLTYRAEFDQIVRASGVDGLIRRMAEKNRPA